MNIANLIGDAYWKTNGSSNQNYHPIIELKNLVAVVLNNFENLCSQNSLELVKLAILRTTFDQVIQHQYYFTSIKQISGNALGLWICGCRCFLESSWSQNSGCTQYQKPQNQRVQGVMSQRSAGSCTRCTRANAFPGYFDNFKNKKQVHCMGSTLYLDLVSVFRCCAKFSLIRKRVIFKCHFKYKG